MVILFSDAESLSYVHNPRSLIEGTETLCHDWDDNWEPQSSLILRENANEIWLVDFAC